MVVEFLGGFEHGLPGSSDFPRGFISNHASASAISFWNSSMGLNIEARMIPNAIPNVIPLYKSFEAPTRQNFLTLKSNDTD